MRPSPYRWIPVISLALVLLLWLSLDLLPRFVGGLLGPGASPSTFSPDSGEALPEIIWDTRDPRLESAQPSATPSPTATAPSIPFSDETVDRQPVNPGGGEKVSGESIRDKQDAEAARSPTSPAPGRGPGVGPRRAPRLLYQEWPRQELLSRIRVGGDFRFRLRVEGDGRVSEWELLDSFDCPPCSEEALRIVRGLRFRPALENGKAVACWVPFEIHFYGPGEE